MELLPNNIMYDGVVRQLVRISSSVGANYRAACRAKSTADLINKLRIVEEEADETAYWLDLLESMDSGKNKQNIHDLLKELNELVSIYSASLITIKNKVANSKNRTS